MIVTHRHAIHLARDPAEVFDYLTDVDNLPRWQSTVLSVRRLPGPARGLGTRVEEVRCLLGQRITSRWRVTDHEPAVLAGVTLEHGPLQGVARYRLTPVRGGTHLVFEVDLHRVELPLPIRRAGLHAARVLLSADALRLRSELEPPGRASASSGSSGSATGEPALAQAEVSRRTASATAAGA